LRVESQTINKVLKRKYLSIKSNNDSIDFKVPWSLLVGKEASRKSLLVKKDYKDKVAYKSHEIDGHKVYLYTDANQNLKVTSRINNIFRIRQRLFARMTKRGFVAFGVITNLDKKFRNVDQVYVNDQIVGEVKRPFSKWKLKHIGLVKISSNIFFRHDEIHNTLSVGDSSNNKVPLNIKSGNKRAITYHGRKKISENLLLLRTTGHSGNVRVTRIPYQKEYDKVNIVKNIIASKLKSFYKSRRNTNLMFEKESNKADESGYYVFEKIMEQSTKLARSSKTYFILDKDHESYSKIKSKHGRYIIPKYSFKHYFLIYVSDFFISSELSNHVVGTRLYIGSLNSCINKKPLIFLQHGIMFSKPVDNPAAAGFRKGAQGMNVYKSVICSDLEATQFHKLGYRDDDLIKCGLPKFDISTMSPTADKIMLMLTYRFWEEGMVNDNSKIKNTTYFKTYKKIIEAFEDAGMIHRLTISAHPKFYSVLAESFPKYKDIIIGDVGEALSSAKLFITDYSSASYDAHHRGSYIIYFWGERDYLIENYQAIPPIDESNCDGVPVFSIKDLINETRGAIKRNFKMEDKYEKRYKMINEFSDGKNAERLISALKELNVL